MIDKPANAIQKADIDAYGIEEAGGVPTAAPGVAITDYDDLRLRLQNTLHSNLDPRLPAVEIEQISGFPDGVVLIVRAHQSWRAPHMVTFKGLSKFYVRGNGQRHEMDVTELRSAFVGSEAVAQRIREFRDGRLARVISGQSAMGTLPLPTTIVHLLPIGTAFSNTDLDPRQIASEWMLLNRERELFQLVFSPSARPNLDGLLIHSPYYEQQNGLSPSYIQVFRNAGVEFAEGHYYNDEIAPMTSLNGVHAEAQILDIVRNTQEFRRSLGITGPALLSVAILRANGLAIEKGGGWGGLLTAHKFDRDTVLLPDILLDDDSYAELPRALRPVFDSFWQAAGFTGSSSYDEGGAYVRPRIR